jgi:hypothetical protein
MMNNVDKITVGIYAPNLPKKELIGVLYIQINEPTERVYIYELPKQSGFRPPEFEARLLKDRDLLLKFIDQLFSASNKLGGTKAIVKMGDFLVFDSWFNPVKSRPPINIPESITDIKIEVY